MSAFLRIPESESNIGVFSSRVSGSMTDFRYASTMRETDVPRRLAYRLARAATSGSTLSVSLDICTYDSRGIVRTLPEAGNGTIRPLAKFGLDYGSHYRNRAPHPARPPDRGFQRLRRDMVNTGSGPLHRRQTPHQRGCLGKVAALRRPLAMDGFWFLGDRGKSHWSLRRRHGFRRVQAGDRTFRAGRPRKWLGAGPSRTR